MRDHVETAPDERAAPVGVRRHARLKHATADRMAWYAQEPNEAFWYEHWRRQLTPDYYHAAERHDLARDEMGRILLANLPSEGLHLEAGCGAGYWVAALRAHGFDVEGIEYSRELVQLVNTRNSALPVRHGNVLAIDAPAECYSSYLSFGVIEHRADGPTPFLSEAFRVLRPGGKIIVSVPYFGPLRRLKARLGRYERTVPSVPFYQYAWNKNVCVSALEVAGFRASAVRPLFVHRLLAEESLIYRRLVSVRGGRLLKSATNALLRGRDGHMLMIVGEKPWRATDDPPQAEHGTARA